MQARDAFRYINDLDAPTIEAIIARLEYRGADPTFAAMRAAYLDRLTLPPAATVLDVGCGTGVVARALARRPGFDGRVIGLDQSPALLTAARRLAGDEGVADRVEFAIADAERLAYPDGHVDAVIAHTTISHVGDPLAMLREMRRVTRPGGWIAIFDGDYASWTFAYPEPALAKAMDEAFVAAIVNSPRIMRDLPRLLREVGLTRAACLGWVYADVGAGDFYGSAAETYAPLVARGGLLPADQIAAWLAEQRRARAAGEFFAACNYYAYLAQPA